MVLETCIQDVSAFMVACGQEVGVGMNHPQTDLYISLINEEFGEFIEGVKTGNLVEILDGAIDTIWVVSGYLISRYGNEPVTYLAEGDFPGSLDQVVAGAQAFVNSISVTNVLSPKYVIYTAAVQFCSSLLRFCHALYMRYKDAWEEVRRSNMSKLDPETGVAIKREDGKILKPASFSPADLHDFVCSETPPGILPV